MAECEVQFLLLVTLFFSFWIHYGHYFIEWREHFWGYFDLMRLSYCHRSYCIAELS